MLLLMMPWHCRVSYLSYLLLICVYMLHEYMYIAAAQYNHEMCTHYMYQSQISFYQSNYITEISGDIGRRSETIKRWNVDVSEARQAESTFNQWQQASTTLPPGTNFARRSAFPSRPKQRPTRELANLQDYNEEEKKQEDYTGTSQFLEGVSSSDTYESLESLFHTVKRSSANIILSLNDDYYKEIMWRHYRVLGKVRDSVKEAELASRLFGLFKKEMGSAGRFFKQDHGVDVEVSEKLAADSKFFFSV